MTGRLVAPAAPSRVQALAALGSELSRAGVPDAAHDAEALLLHALGLTRAALWGDPEAPIATTELARLDELGRARARRVPLQLLLGAMDFHRVTLDVAAGVFIPRPETEVLVETVLGTLAGIEGWDQRPGALLDLGTGSGAIAVALLAALPGWRGVAVDRSPAAVALTLRNAQRNGVSPRLNAMEGDFLAPSFRPTGAPFDLVVGNPPYVPQGLVAHLMPEVRDHDPAEALDGGPDGLDALRGVARGLHGWLRPGGALALEIGEDQADACLECFGGLLEAGRVAPDLAGRPRVLCGFYRG